MQVITAAIARMTAVTDITLFFLFIAFPPYQPTSPLVSTLSTRLRFVKIKRTTRGMAYKTMLVFLRIDLK